jgi:hypothetical protein
MNRPSRIEPSLLRYIAPLALLLGLASSACSGKDDSSDLNGSGGSAGTGNGPSSEACQAFDSLIDPTLLIDDFEDTNSLIAVAGSRNGAWWLATDMTGGTTTPPGDQAAPPERLLGSPRCGTSKYAMRISGQGFTNWGVSLIANFRYTTDLAPIDATGMTGVIFWARVGSVNNAPIRAQFQDGYTYPQGGICNPTDGQPDSCFNGFGTILAPIDTEWRSYKLPFNHMAQRDFGLRRDALDLSTLYAIEFGMEQNTVFDLWIDDLWFY